jgi:hypothetical protein
VVGAGGRLRGRPDVLQLLGRPRRRWTSTVEQTGTEADCADGAASYQGWFEMFPAAPVFFGETVQSGDAMSASVVANGGTTGATGGHRHRHHHQSSAGLDR